MTIELLYVDGCPNHEALLAHLDELLEGSEPSPDVVLRRIADDGAAQRERFLARQPFASTGATSKPAPTTATTSA